LGSFERERCQGIVRKIAMTVKGNEMRKGGERERIRRGKG
jgi:hypothetical protein